MVARCVLAVFILLTGAPAVADEKADIEAVEKEIALQEKEIALQNEARAILLRADKRAWTAVRKSSIARRYADSKKATETAYRKYLSVLSNTRQQRLLKNKWIKFKKEEIEIAERMKKLARIMRDRFAKEELNKINRKELDALRKRLDALLQPRTDI